jgi:hypothetical protein
MDSARWYLQTFLNQPLPSVGVEVPVPEVSADGLLGMVQKAARLYCLKVNSVLSMERLVIMRQRGEQRQRVTAWLAVLDAGDDVDQAVAALPSVPNVGDLARMDRSTTVFDEIQGLADIEARVSADRASLAQAIAFYLQAVDQTVAHCAQFLQTCDDVAEQRRVAMSAIATIRGYTERISTIQSLAEPGCGTRPAC